MSRFHALRLLLAGATLAAGFVLLDGYVTDDTYIHLRYAENLLERGEFAFNPGEASYGATSPLWILGLVGLLAVGVPPLTAAWLLGLLCAVAAVVLFDAILTRLPFRTTWKFWLLLLMAGDVWFLRWTRSGMETPMATLALLALLWPLVAERRPGGWLAEDPGRPVGMGPPLWRRYLVWGIAAGLGGLTRPEFMLVGPLALPWLLLFEYHSASDAGGAAGRFRARPHAPIVAAITGWLLIVLPWLIFAALTFGRLSPGTAAAKSGVVNLVPGEVFAAVARSVVQLAVVQGPLWISLAVLALLALGVRRRAADVMPRQAEEAGESVPSPLPGLDFHAADTGRWTIWLAVALVLTAFTWTATLIAGYALKQVWIISRYVAPLAPPLLLAGGVLAVWLADSLGSSPRRRMLAMAPLVAGVVATLMLNVTVYFTQARYDPTPATSRAVCRSATSAWEPGWARTRRPELSSQPWTSAPWAMRAIVTSWI